MTNDDYVKFIQRMPKSLHQVAKKLAKTKEMSLNSLINEVMANYSGESLDTDIIAEFRKRLEALEKEVFDKKKK